MNEQMKKEDPERPSDNEASFLLHVTTDSSMPHPNLPSFPSTLATLTLKEISEMAKYPDQPLSRDQTRFFRIVKGGNVKFVEEVLEYLHNNNMHTELAWCLGDPRLWKSDEYRLRCVDGLLHVLWFFFLFVATVILTPIFYMVHTLVHVGIQSRKARLDTCVKLPLAFALLSQEEEMVELFLRRGCQVTWPDSEGNTIYHYLADVSQRNHEAAKSCHMILYKLIKDIPTMRKVITEQQNNEGVTALEYIAKHGSIIFFEFIIGEQVALGQPILHVSRDALWSKDTVGVAERQGSDINASHLGDTQIMQAISDGRKSLNVLEVDVSRYDQEDIFGRHSLILQAIACRSVDSMTEVNANCILNSKLLSSWMNLKSSRYFLHCLIGHLLNITVTGLLVWYLVKNGGDINPLPLFSTYLIYLSENLAAAERQLQVSLNTTSFEEIVDKLDRSPGSDYGLHALTCLARVNHTDRGTINCTMNALARINASCGGMSNEELWANTLGTHASHYTTLWRDNLVLVLLILISSVLVLSVLVDLVIRIGFLCASYNFRTTPRIAATRFFLRWLPGSYLEKQLTTVMAFLFFFYIYSHVLMRDMIVSRKLWISKLVQFIVVDVDAQRLAIERGRLGDVIDGFTSLADNINRLGTLSNKIMNICILIRFFQAIHSLRLLPNIGFFIITTKKMAKHLLQFALVFVIVSLAFGTIFHFVMRHPKCHALKVTGFETLASSLFSAYQISLGSGGFSFLENNINAKIAYIAYTITAMLLLLNLIIAVMTTTALELNQSPWRPALCLVESWDEYLGTEIVVLTITWPIKAVARICRRLFSGRKVKQTKPPTIIQLTYIT